MCFARQKKGCQFPNKLKEKPSDCTPKQIKECHGSIREHPCVPRKSKKKWLRTRGKEKMVKCSVDALRRCF